MKIKSNIAISDNGFVFDPNTGDSYNLNNTAAEILQMLKSGKNEQEIIKEFTGKYDVDETTFEQNLYDFLGMLGHYDLVEKEQTTY
ncbi:MAG: HPr-rel-A system PqqD family peptide chaperone [Bacteroidales bacterium]|nr:HPr-rel-A system PqqD family peptide chaperone [Bacteroidales bacterium]